MIPQSSPTALVPIHIGRITAYLRHREASAKTPIRTWSQSPSTSKTSRSPPTARRNIDDERNADRHPRRPRRHPHPHRCRDGLASNQPPHRASDPANPRRHPRCCRRTRTRCSATQRNWASPSPARTSATPTQTPSPAPASRRAGLRTGVGREAHQRGRGATVPGCLCPDRSRRRPDRQPAASTEPSTRAKRPSTAFASASSPPQTPRAATNSASASPTMASSSPRTSSTTGCTPASASKGLPLLRLTHCGGGGPVRRRERLVAVCGPACGR